MDYKKVYELIKVVVDKYYDEDAEEDGMIADDYMEEIEAYIEITEEGLKEIEKEKVEKLEGLAGFFKFLNDSLANKGIRLEESLLDEYLAVKK